MNTEEITQENIKDENPDLQERDLYTDDLSTKYNKPAIRLAINFLAALILGSHFDVINNTYFASVAMFVLPMTFEYVRFTPRKKVRKILKYIELTLLVVILIVCFMGFIGILEIVPINKQPHIMVQIHYVVAAGFNFPAIIFWGLVFVSFFISAIDVFAANINAESKFTSKHLPE